MASLFGWLDHSEQDRKRMLEVIDLFREADILPSDDRSWLDRPQIDLRPPSSRR
jgi:hypothetical protein